MFDWFWSFLYSITKSLLSLCDWLMECANKLCGIENIQIEGESTDFMTYLLTSRQVTFAFGTICVLSFIIITIFCIFSIIRNTMKEQPGISPGQVVVKAMKSILMYMLMPTIMVALVAFLNVFMNAVYQATLEGGATIGSYLFTIFAENAGLSDSARQKFLSGALDYTDTDVVWSQIDLSDFEFIFSWIVGGVCLVNISSTMLMFVERAISIVILYIVSPFSISTCVIDDGTHFKMWREQVIKKFLVAYGCVIAINVFCLVSSLIISDGFQFFTNSVLNYVAKILIVAGAAVTLKKSAGLIGDLIGQGGGQEAMSGMSQPGLGAALGKAISTPFKAARGIANFATEAKAKGFKTAAAHLAGFKVASDFKGGGGGGGGGQGGQGEGDGSEESSNKNEDEAKYNGANLNDALEGGEEEEKEKDDNQNNNEPKQGGNNMMNQALNNNSETETKNEEEE